MVDLLLLHHFIFLTLFPCFATSNDQSGHVGARSNLRLLRSGSSYGGQPPFHSESESDISHRQLTIASSVQSIREEIRDLIRNNNVLAPKFLRLAFHDCVGGCDGCVDMTNPDNAGLDVPMDALSGIVSTWKSSDISRADIWSLAAMVGSEMTQAHLDFTLDYVGRIDCEDTGRECLDEFSISQECRQDLGDAHTLPDSNLLVHEILAFFADNFGFNAQETVALMGAHSIGTASQENSGFNGPVGWDNTNYFLDNDYYKMLVGGDPNKSDPRILEDLIEFAPGWTQQTIVNSGGIPNRIQWNRGRTQDTARIISLNTDIGLARDLSGEIDSDGDVSCNFKNPAPRCPVASQTLDWMTTYRYDEEKFLEDFESVMKKMIVAGYDADTELTSVPAPVSSTVSLPKISVAQASYSSGQAVQLTVENPDGDRVWIAIRRHDISPHDSTGAGSSEAWAYVCGSTTCTDQSMVSNTFDINDIGDGLWRAYLMKDMTFPYEAMAFSSTFSVGSTGISSSVARYESGATVSLSFANIWSSRFWITVFPADSTPDDAQSGSLETWAWPCGDQTCNGDTMSSGEVSFSGIGDGVWRAFIMLDMYSPYESVAYTDSFAVGAVDQIFVSKAAYSVGENVEVTFYNPSGARVWIGVYSASSNPSNIEGSTEAWAWPCGTTSCTDQYLTEGTFELSVGEGEWRVFMMQDMTYPYSSAAYSDVFVVAPSSTTQPTNQPTAVVTSSPTHSPTSLPTALSTPVPTSSLSSNPSKAPSEPPTNIPTKEPTAILTSLPTDQPIATSSPTPPPMITSKTIVCGRGDIEDKPCTEGLKRTAPVNEIHEVRCCRDCTGRNCSKPWKEKCPDYYPNLFAISKVDGECKVGTFSEALDFCTSIEGVNARLCTPLEMENSCAKGTGCKFDQHLIWTCAYDGHECVVNSECCGSCVNGQCESVQGLFS